MKKVFSASAKKANNEEVYIHEITVKTREIIPVVENAAHENQPLVCPVCHAPLSTGSLSADESSAVQFPVRKTIELPAVLSKQEKQS